MSPGEPRRLLSTFDAVAVIVSIVIGAGIFRLPSLVAGQLGDPWIVLAAWAAGGLISLVGALCFAELVSAYPNTGGEYHFLRRAFGPQLGFMFAWARMSVVQTGAIALLAYIFGDYAQQLLPLGPHGPAIHAAGAIVVLTALNLAGIRESRRFQIAMFAATLLGLGCLILAGLVADPAASAVAVPDTSPDGPGAAAFGLAMVFVLLTYGGWNEASYISAEMRGDRRAMARALIFGIGLIALLYIAINAAFLWVLGSAGMAGSQAPASDVMDAAFGSGGATFVTVLIVVVVLASINVTILTGARTNFALGQDVPLLAFLAQWSDRGAPVNALLLQGAISLGLVLVGMLGRSGVETAVEYLSPVFWFFFLLTGLSLFVLRYREPAAERPFPVPLYPLTPALFCLVSAWMLYSSLIYTGIGALTGVAVLAAGLPIMALARRHGMGVPDRTT